MDLKADFIKAQEEVKSLKNRPSNEDLLGLYSFFKQANEGDVSGKRPGMLDMKGRAKFDAWSKISGMNEEEAMNKYVQLVKNLLEKDN